MSSKLEDAPKKYDLAYKKRNRGVVCAPVVICAVANSDDDDDAKELRHEAWADDAQDAAGKLIDNYKCKYHVVDQVYSRVTIGERLA